MNVMAHSNAHFSVIKSGTRTYRSTNFRNLTFTIRQILLSEPTTVTLVQYKKLYLLLW